VPILRLAESLEREREKRATASSGHDAVNVVRASCGEHVRGHDAEQQGEQRDRGLESR
jgi:hypothetical protein